jgi:hypothetical protein
VAAACQKDPVVTDRAVTLHAPQTCAPGLANLDAEAYAVYHALGDFEPPATPPDGLLLKSVGSALPEIDPSVRAIQVDATQGDRLWQGTTPVASDTGPVDVLVLPAATPCGLRGPGVSATGAVIGSGGSQDMLIVGGSGDAISFRLGTGAIDAVAGTVRTDATVTAFGTGALLAGGTGPGGTVLADGAVYDPARGAFTAPTIGLSGPRKDAGATVLATGETLLVGGVGADGTTPLGTMEIVDPVSRKARLAGATLAYPSRAPTVLRLASGEIFVAGVDASSGTPETKLEWFASDASRATRPPALLVAGSARAYVPLQGGGVLAVIAPPPGSAPGFQNTWVIDPDGNLEPATPLQGTLGQPVLFGTAGGAPVLWTGSTGAGGGDGGTPGSPGRWLRWQPWTGAFGALDVLDDVPGRVVAIGASPDPGTALWLDVTAPDAPRLAALRFDARGEYSTLAGPLLATDASDVAPDRLVTGGMVSFDPQQGLILLPGASAGVKGGSAFVTDRTYADVRIQVDAPTGQPALIVLRDGRGNETEVGSAACSGAVVVGAASSITVERRGTNLTWSLAQGASSFSGSCTLGFAADARVSVGLRASFGLTRSVARNLRVTRLGSP